MFSKTAVVVSTAAGAGMNHVTKSLAKQLFYMGVPKVYRFPVRVAAMSWEGVKSKDRISAGIDKIARKIVSKNGMAKPGIKLRLMFSIMRQMQKRNDWAALDKKYWEDREWLGKARPWRNNGGGRMIGLGGKIAVVTGSRRGVGKGVALGLATYGVTVYVTGRTENDN